MKHKIILLVTSALLLVSCYKKQDQTAEIQFSNKVQFCKTNTNEFSTTILYGLQTWVNISANEECNEECKNPEAWDTNFKLRNIQEFSTSNNPLTISKQIKGILKSSMNFFETNLERYLKSARLCWQNTLSEIIPFPFTVKLFTHCLKFMNNFSNIYNRNIDEC